MEYQSFLFEEITFFAFLGLALWLFGRVLRDPRQFLTFPVVTSAIWLAYIAPQAFGILYNPIHLPPEVFEDGFGKTMIMCSLCIIMGVWGWRIRLKRAKPRASLSESLTYLNPSRLALAGSVLTFLGYFAFGFITRQTGGIIGFYSVGGNYALDWLGGEVIAVFFMLVFLNTGLIVLMFSLLMRPRIITGIMVLVALAPSIADIVILNRRSDVVYVAIALLGPAFFVRNWVPSRNILMVGVVAGMIVVFGFPVIRGTLLIGADQQVNLVEAFQEALFVDVLGGNHRKEFNNSIGIVASADRLGEFGFGALTWNSWVKTTIPRTFFGEEIKVLLRFNEFSLSSLGQRAYGWVPVWFQSRSAAALMFVEFWYFGSLAFFVIGYGFAHLYVGANAGRIDIQMQYTAILLLLPHWVAVGFYKAPRNLIVTLLILVAVCAFARVRHRYRSYKRRQREFPPLAAATPHEQKK